MASSLLHKSLGFVYWKLLGAVGITPEKKNLRYHRRRQAALIEGYLKDHQIRKLQIGAQNNSIEGWLNVDILPKSRSVCYLDATQTFPIAADSFDYVFSEHMIEHITYEEAAFMLREVYRILRPNGKIRLATPDLDALAALMNDPGSPDHTAYIGYYQQRFFPEKPAAAVYVVNRLFYGFHHRFIHNLQSLTHLLQAAGFTHITRREVHESEDVHLQNLEQHWREMGALPNRIESIIVEAVKLK